MLVVLGNACLDITHRLERLPLHGETINALAVSEDLGGKGLNQAVMARRAGAPVRFIAPVGDDEIAERVRRLLASEGIPDQDLLAGPGRSDRSVIFVDQRGENVIVTDALRSIGLQFDAVADRCVFDHGDGLLLQGNLSVATSKAAAEAARRAGARVILNPAPFSPAFVDLGRLADVVIVNAVEAMQWTGAPSAAEALIRLGTPIAIVTLGASGCILSERSMPPVTIEAPATTAIDTVGAGDTFVGTFVAEWLVSGDAERSALLAVAVASLKVRHSGTVSAFPTQDEIAGLRQNLEKAG
jgi:ribokinase